MDGMEVENLQAELSAEEAEQDIEKAVSARHSIARKYVRWIRRRHPEASPAEVIALLEKHYARSITTAGAIMSAGSIAASVGISMIPVLGQAAAAGQSAGKQAAGKVASTAAGSVAKSAAKNVAKNAAKGAGKGMAKNAAGVVANKAVALLPAGDQQLQFELTAIFALAIADLHGMRLDQAQAQALVFGLTNERISQKQIAAMAADVAANGSEGSAGGSLEVAQKINAGREDWSHWADTLSSALPGGAAKSLVSTMKTGQLDVLRSKLSGQQQSTIEYGVGAIVGGVTRFTFGKDVVAASRTAFSAPPEHFPSHLALEEAEEDDGEPSRALAALEDAARATGTWLSDAAGTVGGGVATGFGAVGTGVATAAGNVSRPFRSVDIDGDGLPDEPQALTKIKGLGSALAGTADSVGDGVAGLFRRKKRADEPSEPNESVAAEAATGQRLAGDSNGAATADESAEGLEPR